MDAAFGTIDWSSPENHVRLNPRWPAEDRDFLQKIAERALEERKLRSFLVVTSSGTTAESWRAVKLIFISKQAFLKAADSVVREFSLGPEDVFLQSLPSFHVGGLGLQARAHLSGGRVVPMPAWNPALFADFLSREKATILSLVPAQIHDLIGQGIRAPAFVRWVFVGAGALSQESEAQARLLGWPLVLTFGMTETSAMIAGRAEIGEGLHPFPGVEGALNSEGLLKVKAPGLATASLRWKDGESHWDEIADAEGWYQTRDRVRLDGGRWFIEGRDQDFVKVNGESVSLPALREILSKALMARSLATADFHLTALPHERSGFRLALIANDSVDQEKVEALRREYDKRVLPFERIHEILFLTEIPRTELGKVRDEDVRRLLREMNGGSLWKA